MDSQELANALFGASRIENTSPKTMTTLQGVAVSDSADGKVKVKLLNAESVPEENDATEENTVVELMTTPAVKEGDTVVVTAEGGVLKTMSVTGNYGSGDKQTADTEEAAKVADNFIQLTNDNNIIIGNLSSESAQNNATDTNIIFECTGTVSQNDVAFSKDGHIHTGLFEKKEVSATFEIKASSNIGLYIPCSTVTGKTPLMVSDYSITGVTDVSVLGASVADNGYGVYSARFGLKNLTTEAISGSMTANVLYVTDGWIKESE